MGPNLFADPPTPTLTTPVAPSPSRPHPSLVPPPLSSPPLSSRDARVSSATSAVVLPARAGGCRPTCRCLCGRPPADGTRRRPRGNSLARQETGSHRLHNSSRRSRIKLVSMLPYLAEGHDRSRNRADVGAFPSLPPRSPSPAPCSTTRRSHSTKAPVRECLLPWLS